MALRGTKVLKNKNRTATAKSLVIYSDSGLGKSSLCRNAPNAVYLNLENRLGHIEGTFSEERILNLDEFEKFVSDVKKEKSVIRRLEELVKVKDTKALETAKKSLKDDFQEYYDIATGKSPYIKLLMLDAMDDLYGMVIKEKCAELGVKDLSEPDRNQGYGIAKTRFLDLVRETMNLGIPIIMFCGITKAKEGWNTEGKDIPFVGSGSSYKVLARKVTGVFAIDEEPNGVRYIQTNPKNGKFFIKNSFDDFFNGKKLPDKIELDFEELNKWVGFYTKEEIDAWKKQHNLKKL